MNNAEIYETEKVTKQMMVFEFQQGNTGFDLATVNSKRR